MTINILDKSKTKRWSGLTNLNSQQNKAVPIHCKLVQYNEVQTIIFYLNKDFFSQKNAKS